MKTFIQFAINEETDQHPSGIEGLPSHVNLDHPSFAPLHAALKRGAFRMKATERKDHWGAHAGYDVEVHPKHIPKHWKTHEGTHYDPRHMEVKTDEYPGFSHHYVGPRDQEKADYTPEGKEHGHLFRGMSHDEYKDALKNGHIQSRGDHNFGRQHGLTYYSKDKGQATSYAHGFAPWAHSAVPGKPAVVVKVKDPGTGKHHEGEGEDEVGVPGKVSTKDIKGVHFGHAVSSKPGSFEIRAPDVSSPHYHMGSSSAISTRIHWSHEHPPQKH